MKRILLAALAVISLSAPLAAQTPTTGLVSVRLPRDARLYVDDVFCPLPGEERSFETPPLDTGKRYYYELRIEITVDAKPIRLSKRAIIQAGRRSDVDFGTREEIIAAAKKVEPKKADDPPPQPAGPAALPQSLPPVAVMAKASGDFLIVTKIVCHYEDATEERTREVDGKTEKYPVTVKKMVCKPVSEQIKFSGVTATEAPGFPIPAAKLRERLAKETNAYLTDALPVDPVYLKLMKDGTIILSIGREAVVDRPVPPPPPPVEESAEPRGSNPPLLVKAWLKDGFIVWRQTVPVVQEVAETVTKKGPDGKDIQEKVFKKVIVQKEVETKIDAKSATLATVGSKPVDAAELAARLEKPAPVIFSHEPIAAFHLQLYDADALTVVAPRVIPQPVPVKPEGPAPKPIEKPKT